MSSRENKILALFLLVIGTLTVLDVVEDLYAGASLSHVVPEFITAFLAMILGIYLFTKFARDRERKLELASKLTEEVKQDASRLQQQLTALQIGLTDSIHSQLAKWGLTEAEIEVCMLLIKGFSLKEISELRGVSERTVRQQSSSIYGKSGVEGRAQLAAFFLEDLLGPREGANL